MVNFYTMEINRKALFESFPRVPEEEIKKRLLALQERLKEKEVDLALILQNVDLFYLTGSLQRGFLLVSKEEATFFVQRDYERAQWESPLPLKKVEGLSELKKVPFLEKAKRVGLEFDVLPLGMFLRIKEVFKKEADFVDVSSDILYLRSIKSPYELEQIREAVRITSEVLSLVPELLKPGLTEVELDARLQYEGRRRGNHGWLRMRGFNQEMCPVAVVSGINGGIPSYVDGPIKALGTCPAIGFGTSFKVIQRNEPIIVDYGVCINGYVSDETRSYVIGNLHPKLEKAYEVSLEVIQLMEKEAKPGVPVKNLYEMALEIVRAHDLEGNFMGFGENRVKFIAHGIGLEINEWPIIAERKEILREGMTFALEPKFVFPDLGAIGVELDYVVQKGGISRLGSLPPHLFYL
jgi:Xaa-Pro aminopeptidase